MANPVFVPVTANEWVIVATSVLEGFVHIIEPTDSEWYHTYRLTGDPEPTEQPEVKMQYQTSEINSQELIDVYVYHKATDGKVRVDL